ncbi:histidine kinase [Zavarzinia compransoris]|uniref:Signal transduction histidine kinase internal region domain-containing protein n=2 Tax=Zavarzinia compransoris TaxID=1264899 RepID=A0A317DTS3_9PROT|nr:hypothetical protein DKG75_21400 [Zavarzinia compransoris]TDP43436.1 histidine kinase [Zavarzinia compransoris]
MPGPGAADGQDGGGTSLFAALRCFGRHRKPRGEYGRDPETDHFWRLFPFMIFIIYGFGILVRFDVLPTPLASRLFSLGIDTLMIAVLLLSRAFIRRSRIADLGLAAWGIVVLLSALTSVFMVAVTVAVEDTALLQFHTLQMPLQHRASYNFFIPLTVNSLTLWLHVRFRENLRVAAAEREVNLAEVRRLRQQLDPHFIFNGLNMIAVDIMDQPQKALAMLREMANYLRYSLDTAEIPFIPVSAEVAALHSYLEVQVGRFAPRLLYDIDVDGAARDRMIPTFLVQPLVENAVKYGFAGDDGLIRIALGFQAAGDDLLVTVGNTGDLRFGSQIQGVAGTGTGLSNLRNRLKLHYPGRHSFEMRQEGPMAIVRLRLAGEPE